MKMTTTVFALALLVLVACDENPDERTLLTGPRLLSVRSTPPALRGFDGFVALDSLALGDDGAVLAEGTVRYRACSPWAFLVDPQRDCPESQALALTGGELSTEQLLAFYPPPAGASDGYLADDETAGQACTTRAVIEVPILAEATIDGVSLVTVKRIPIYLDETDKHNPELDDIEVAEGEEGERVLTIAVDPNSLDLECRNERESLEAIRIYAYSTSGSFDASSVDIVPSAEGEVGPVQLRWTPSEDSALLLFVAVDNDGGVDWKTLTL